MTSACNMRLLTIREVPKNQKTVGLLDLCEASVGLPQIINLVFSE